MYICHLIFGCGQQDLYSDNPVQCVYIRIAPNVFEGELAPLQLAEVEFETKEEAEHFVPPAWFGEDVTFSSKYHNST